MIFSGAPVVKSYAEYTYLIGKRDTLVEMLKPRKRVKKEDKDKKLPEYGLRNPVAPAPSPPGKSMKDITTS